MKSQDLVMVTTNITHGKYHVFEWARLSRSRHQQEINLFRDTEIIELFEGVKV